MKRPWTHHGWLSKSWGLSLLSSCTELEWGTNLNLWPHIKTAHSSIINRASWLFDSEIGSKMFSPKLSAHSSLHIKQKASFDNMPQVCAAFKEPSFGLPCVYVKARPFQMLVSGSFLWPWILLSSVILLIILLLNFRCLYKIVALTCTNAIVLNHWWSHAVKHLHQHLPEPMEMPSNVLLEFLTSSNSKNILIFDTIVYTTV